MSADRPTEKSEALSELLIAAAEALLARGEKEGGGSLPKLAPLNWKRKGGKIHKSLLEARDIVEKSRDPLRKNRYFLAAAPTKTIRKQSTSAKLAPDGIREESTDYAGEHSRVFRRLGVDLLAVDHEGRALVHAQAGKLDQLLRTTNTLETEGKREQARWIAIDSFFAAPVSFRIDDKWISSLPQNMPLDSVIELQPLLTRVEVDQVVHAILELILPRNDQQKFTRTGTDFSGRHWFRGMLFRDSLKLIAKEFFSVQALHPPLSTPITVSSPRRGLAATPVQATIQHQTNVDLVSSIQALCPRCRNKRLAPLGQNNRRHKANFSPSTSTGCSKIYGP